MRNVFALLVVMLCAAFNGQAQAGHGQTPTPWCFSIDAKNGSIITVPCSPTAIADTFEIDEQGHIIAGKTAGPVGPAQASGGISSDSGRGCLVIADGIFYNCPSTGPRVNVVPVKPVVLAWDRSDNPDATYNVYRAPSKCSQMIKDGFTNEVYTNLFHKINEDPIIGTTFTDPNSEPDQYCYYVTDVVGSAESDPSNLIQLEQPPPPSGLHQVTGSKSKGEW
jgi:hypothetical protein